MHQAERIMSSAYMRSGCPFPLQTRAPMLGNMELSAWQVAILVTFVREALRSTGKCSFSSYTRVMTAADSRAMLSSNNVDCGGEMWRCVMKKSSLLSNDVEMRGWRCEVGGDVGGVRGVVQVVVWFFRNCSLVVQLFFGCWEFSKHFSTIRKAQWV
jgi:hypothetical protein